MVAPKQIKIVNTNLPNTSVEWEAFREILGAVHLSLVNEYINELPISSKIKELIYKKTTNIMSKKITKKLDNSTT